MIRNVVLGKLKADADRELIAEGLAGIEGLGIEGTIAVHTGLDAGLRDGNADFVITNDFEDVAAYRRYDEDEEHNRLRREIFGPQSEQVTRIQFEI